MPELGDIKQGQAIGKTIWRAHIWHACIGCGKERWVALVKGKPESLRCCNCARQRQVGVNHPNWRGGRIISHQGYIYIKLQPDDFFYSMATKSGYVIEHRLVVAKALNRCLLPWEVVHHKGNKSPLGSRANKQDNRYPENLELLPGRKYHLVDTMSRSLIASLQKRVTLLEAENALLRAHNDPSMSMRTKGGD